MSTDNVNQTPSAELIYGLEDRPPFGASMLAAFQHLMAALAAIVAPTLIIGSALDLGSYLPYLVSMALLVSGLGTYIQSKRIGPVGAGLLTLQGTSFTFVPAIIAAGLGVQNKGGSPEDMLALIAGLALAGSLLPIILSRHIDAFKRVITPTTTGVIITIVGLSLISIAVKDMAGINNDNASADLTSLAIGLFVVLVIMILSFVSATTIRMAAILIGMAAGWALAAALGEVTAVSWQSETFLVVPIPLRFGLDFQIAYFLPIVLVYLVTIVEAVGDLTANSVIIGEPIKGDTYLRRIRGGVLGDGVSSGIAALLGTFPNTTFSQNNGVIQITGIGSRHIALYLSAMLVAVGLIPVVGNVLASIPKPVLGGATLIMFASIAVAGIRILASEPFNRKRIYVITLSLGLGMAVVTVPEALEPLPAVLQNIFGSAITTGGLIAILATLIIPDGVKTE
ncbi:MAG: solute carrier family 23 protein [Pseudomonadota bacterium]